MSFGLKNADATYQRLINRMFSKQIGKTMEVYVDDILVNSLKADDHIKSIDEMLTFSRRYKMKLNPKRCAIRVDSEKFLGYIVDQNGMKANPDEIKALIEKKSLRRIKKVQSLTGQIAALGRFVSPATDKCMFQALKKGKDFV